MKNIIISFSIFALLLIGILFSVNYLNNACNELVDINTSIETSVRSGNWDNAKSKAKEFSKGWDRHSNIVSLFIHHQEIDNIYIEISKTEIYVKEKNEEETLAGTNTLSFLLKHILKSEKVSLQNIF